MKCQGITRELHRLHSVRGRMAGRLPYALTSRKEAGDSGERTMELSKGQAAAILAAFVMGVAAVLSGQMMTQAEAKPTPSLLPNPSKIEANIHVHGPADIARLRAQALDTVFGGPLPTGEPKAEPITPPFPTVAHAMRFPGEGYYLVNQHPNGKLAIYHAGHDQLALREGRETVVAMLDAGYDVLALSMPPMPHEQYRSLRPFLEPVALALNYATHRKPYREVIMAGLSGGGWTTVVYSALDPRIRRSYPIAGSLPFPLRTHYTDAPDYEQQLPGLAADYLDLYLMAVSDGRQQLQVFNSEDPCCFAGTKALVYRDAVSKRATALGGEFDMVIAGNNQHSLTPGLMRLMF